MRREPSDRKVQSEAISDSPHLIGLKWAVSGWRKWFFISLYSACLFILVAMASDPGFRQEHTPRTTVDTVVLLFYAVACLVWAIGLKGREVRRGKERIRVADEYLAMREERLSRDFDDLCVKFLQQQEEWKAQKTAEIYEQVLDQVERGVLKPRED